MARHLLKSNISRLTARRGKENNPLDVGGILFNVMQRSGVGKVLSGTLKAIAGVTLALVRAPFPRFWHVHRAWPVSVNLLDVTKTTRLVLYHEMFQGTRF